MEQVDRYWPLVQQYVNQQVLTLLQELRGQADTYLKVTYGKHEQPDLKAVSVAAIDEVMKRYQND